MRNLLTRSRALPMGVARRLLSPESYGALRYRYSPAVGRAWGGPLNGQRDRCLLFADLIGSFAPVAIVETGTYLGTTTEWLSAFQLPIYSIEAHSENFGFARARLANTPNVTLLNCDCREGLRALAAGSLKDNTDKPVLFYLDAHWNDDLPLSDELDIAFSSFPEAIVVIDDFEVPGDEGFGFDNYGLGKALSRDYITPAVERLGLSVFYPIRSSRSETGARRGCVAVARSRRSTAVLSSSAYLRPEAVSAT